MVSMDDPEFSMPRYRYHCEHCDHSFDELVWPSEMDRPVPCPRCGSAEAVAKELGRFAVQAHEAPPETPPFCGRCGRNRPPCEA